MNSFETLDIPIIEKDEECEDGIELDSLDLFFSILNNVSKISDIFNRIKGDTLYDIKAGLLLTMYGNLFMAMFNEESMRCDVPSETVISRKYCELCMLYLIIVYKSNKLDHDTDLIKKLSSKFKYFILNT